MISYGEYLKKKRLQKGYSQRKLGLLSGISNTTISRLESGETEKPDIDTLKALEKALDLQENEIVNIAYPTSETENRELTNEEYSKLADEIIEMLIENGEIVKGEKITDEKQQRILNIIDQAIKLTRL